MVKWRVGGLLEQNSVTAYRLSEETRGRISRNAIYEITRADTKQVKLETLITVLHRLTGKRYTVGDLLEYVDDTEPAKA